LTERIAVDPFYLLDEDEFAFASDLVEGFDGDVSIITTEGPEWGFWIDIPLD